MNKFGAISKILWPDHLCKGKTGFLVGWNLRSFISSVATIVPDMTVIMFYNFLIFSFIIKKFYSFYKSFLINFH